MSLMQSSLRGLLAVVLTAAVGCALAQSVSKPNVVVLATGGTIAGAGASAANSATYRPPRCRSTS